MAKVDKLEYICKDKHITRQWSDRKVPQHCTEWQNGLGCSYKPKLVTEEEEVPKKTVRKAKK